MLLHLGKVPVLVVASADAACEIVRNVIFANQPKLTPFVKLLNGCKYVSMAPYGEYLRKVKSLFVVQLLRNKRIHHSFRDVRVEKYSDQGEVGSKFRKQFKDFIELMTTFHVEDYIPWQGWLCYFNSLNAKLKKTSKEVDDFLEVLVNSKMAENVDEGNENDFKENDNVSPKNEILRRNRPFIEYLDFEYIMGIKDGGVDIDVDLGIDDIDKLRNEYCDDSGYIKLKTLESKLVNQREQMQQVMETLKENLTQKQVEQQKENNGTAVGITSPSRKQQKNDKSSHEILTFTELMKRAKERSDGDDILEKKLLDEENVEEKHDKRILTGESDLNEGKRKQIFYNAATQDNGRNDDWSIEEESSNQLSVFEVKDMCS
ncbi:cytochrome P450 71A21 [Citrus sinensis]|nr:cytochrome P450 71A21 [Citrus sinensis]